MYCKLIQNTVYVGFVIGKQGCETDVFIRGQEINSLNKVIIQCIYNIPKQDVGLSQCKKYRSSYALPITFLLN